MSTSNKTKSLYNLVICSMLIALEVVLGRWFAIRTPMVNISFAFVPLSLAGMLFGPVYGCISGGVADFIGAVLFPQGPYFPGFTLTNALCGLVHGLLLHQKDGVRWSHAQFMVRSVISVVIVNLGLQMCLNSYWLVLIGATKKGLWALLGTRITKYLIMIPVQILVINFLRESLVEPILRRWLNSQTSAVKPAT